MAKAFSFEIGMVVTVIAEDEKTARDQLDSQGGFVSKRAVRLIESHDLPNETIVVADDPKKIKSVK
jgi:hypothetical protein